VNVQGASVGATYTLSPSRHEAFAVDWQLSAENVAAQVETILQDEHTRQATAQRACHAARSYTEQSNAEQVVQVVERCVQSALAA
jgi:UDP-N-acetylglucosamine:LPS N-acetylglucosamine transferase